MDDLTAFLLGERRRRRRTLLVVAAVALIAVSAALGGLLWWSRPQPSAPLPSIARPMLWVIERDGARSYLFGTVHIGYRLEDLPASVTAAQDLALATVVESDLVTSPPASRAAPAARPARLTAREWRALATWTRQPVAELETWDASALVGFMLATALPPVEMMDRALQQRAIARGHRLVYLTAVAAGSDDTTAAAAFVADEAPLLAELRRALQHPGALRRQLRAFATRYAQGDDDACDGAADLELTGALNREWATTLEAELRRDRTFAAIGCGHLPGMIAYLRLRGFTVRRSDR
jgi:hypothetical protein